MGFPCSGVRGRDPRKPLKSTGSLPWYQGWRACGNAGLAAGLPGDRGVRCAERIGPDNDGKNAAGVGHRNCPSMSGYSEKMKGEPPFDNLPGKAHFVENFRRWGTVCASFSGRIAQPLPVQVAVNFSPGGGASSAQSQRSVVTGERLRTHAALRRPGHCRSLFNRMIFHATVSISGWCRKHCFDRLYAVSSSCAQCHCAGAHARDL